MDARTWLLLEQDGPSVIAELSELTAVEIICSYSSTGPEV